jgi:tetratricopeptide (TPR) repeat protein/O-antigen ligase
MARTRGSPLSGTGALILAAALVLAPLLRGGVELPVQLAVAAVLGVALALMAGAEAPLAGLGLGLVFFVGALQAVPLVGGLAVSLDAPATGRALASAAATLLAFWGGWVVGGTHRRRERVLIGLGVAGVAVAVASLGAALLQLGTLLNPTFPFVNPNHQSGLLNLCAFTLLGLGLRRHGQARALWLLGFVVTVAALFVTLSRGGIGAFFGGVALFLALATRRQLALPGDHPAHPWRRYAAAGLVAALGVVAYLALEPVLRELATLKTARDDVKLELWRPAWRLIAEHPWLGIGRGSFATVFTGLKTDPAVTTFTHLENEWLQPLIDFGVPAGLLLIGVLGVTWLRSAVRRDLSLVEVGLLSGTAAVAAQNLVDFSLEFSGVGVPFMVALGLLTRGEWGFRLRRGLTVAGVAAVLAVAGAGAAFWRSHPTDEEAAAVGRAATAEAAAVVAEEALRWHRADYVPAAIVGARYVQEGRCAPAMPWLTRAMSLNPTAPEAHQYAARCLSAAGQHPLALREYRLALLYGSGSALVEAAERYEAVEDLLKVVPDTGDGLIGLGYLLLSRQRPEDAVLVFRRALDGALDARALVPLAGALQATGELEEALEVARRRTVETPADPQGWRLVAAVLTAEGYEEEAGAALEAGLAVSPGSPPLVEALVYRSLAARRPAEAKRLAEAMAARTPHEQALKQLLVAASFAAQGRLGEAVERARSAVAALPDSPWPLMTLAAYCQQAGRLDDALAAVERAASLPGQEREAYAARLEELKAARAAAGERRRLEELERPPTTLK